MMEALITTEQDLTPPYGPTKGMMQALQLMRKNTPSKIDSNYLRMNRIAPGNEYKVMGALRFLGIIDDEGMLTEKSRQLKTKGVAFTSAMQGIVRDAYKNVFRYFNGGKCSQEDVYNYFVTEAGLGVEMAIKTTRFFIQLCQAAEIDFGDNGRQKTPNGLPKASVGHQKHDAGQKPAIGSGSAIAMGATNQFPLMLALTPELAAMDTDQLAQFLKKLKTAIAMANAD
ncbi:MAG: DUF5343 domain-containing protein [Chloroflexota bacterium]|nr:DUF5343 domain-containing protein [Chloroflexota bacterium]